MVLNNPLFPWGGGVALALDSNEYIGNRSRWAMPSFPMKRGLGLVSPLQCVTILHSLKL